ncbi:hypothetical protein HL658_31185 [Azospirillum sp. RWY-5-1]|uniref:Uncharacterized protein n=1 Tax=Azospirillum oleiclasticum TaxID=2735135 RepID=A0ABX2TJJ8_9PROT|nr:hypothetical protein [Azospirillum oleiclasticum]NYZ17029.1 hypothetical protein [Azospirillum oleiclasticum]NYZ24527.1 hypothetical protein [Azospirillum oleiclasticum]
MARPDTRRHRILTALEPSEPGAEPPCLTLDELAAATGDERTPMATQLRQLVLAGKVVRHERGCFRIAAGVSAGDPPAPMRRHKPRTGLNARLWRAMRLRGKFTAGDLVRLAARDGEREATVRKGADDFLRALRDCGYLRRLPNGTGPARYALIRDTGPAAPLVRRSRREAFDRNTGETYTAAPLAREEGAASQPGPAGQVPHG